MYWLERVGTTYIEETQNPLNYNNNQIALQL